MATSRRRDATRGSSSLGRSQFDLSLSYAPPALLALAPPDVLTVLILVNPAQTGPQGRQGDYPQRWPLLTLPAHTSVVPTEPSFAETNPCQAVSHARCSASSARPMPTAIDSSAPVSATDDKTQSVAGYKRRAPTAAAGPYVICRQRFTTTPPRRLRKQ